MTSPKKSISSSLAGVLLMGMAMGGATLASQSGPSAAPISEDELQLVCIGACSHPTNAGKVFRWGREKWRNEFEDATFPKRWTSEGTGAIGQRNGMLTIRARTDTDKLVVWPKNRSATRGRWEARVRAVEFDTTGAQFQFNWELAPASGSNCEAAKVILASYKPGEEFVRGAVRTLPDNAFRYWRKTDLRSRAWHTYAVEITRKKIVWFVDHRAVRHERRPEALSGVAFRPQFTLTGVAGTTMRESWMQMDWVRFYTLKRKNAKSVKAPAMLQTTYTGGCSGELVSEP